MNKYSKERKEKQQNGDIPDWYITQGYQLVSQKYQWESSMKNQYESIAKTAASKLIGTKYEDKAFTKIFELLWYGWLSPSTPVLGNMGNRKKGMTVSCSGGYIGDSIHDFYMARHEAAMLTKNCFGTSGYLSDIRARGSNIVGGGKASGSKLIFDMFFADMRDVAQGCYDDKTEVLTNLGWKYFEDVINNKNLLVAQVSDEGYVEFVSPTEYFKYEVDEELISFKDKKNIDLLVTKNHNMVFHRQSRISNKKLPNGKYESNDKKINDSWYTKPADEISLHRDIYFSNSGMLKTGSGLKPIERFLIALQADGNIQARCEEAYRFRFSKKRKVERLEKILLDMGVSDYSKSEYENGITSIYVNLGVKLEKTFSWVDISTISKEWAEEFIFEVLQWDGDQKNTYSSIIKENVDVIQSIACMIGYKCRVTKNNRDKEPNKQPIYKILLSLEKRQLFGVETLQKTTEHYKGFVYCVEVPSHKLLVRRGGHTLVCGNSNRRGSWAGYIHITHGDFDEICDLLHQQPDGTNVGWIVTDEFINSLDDINHTHHKENLRRYQKALKVRMITGKGYFFNVDNANRHRPQCYKDHGLDIKASNLCVAPETLILTDVGYEEISSLSGQTVNVWNGYEWSNVDVVQTGTNQELVKVVTDSGIDLECTPYHKFYVVLDYYGKTIEKRAAELKTGDKLIKLETPIIDGKDSLDLAYQNGFYSGDGCFFNNKHIIYLYGEKRELINNFKEYSTYHTIQENQDREILHLKGLKHKFFVPDTQYDIKSRIEWFSGLLDSDGCLLTNGSSQTLQLASVKLEFLKEVQLMLQTLGVQSKIKECREEGFYNLPKNDGSGENKEYLCQKFYRILISGNGINSLSSLGLNCLRLKITDHIPNRNAERFITIKEVIWTGRKDDTFCFTEPKRHLGVFNGLLCGNCSEISLHSSPEYTFTCVLSSMNVAKYDEWKNTDAVFWATIFLDCVAQEFIDHAEGKAGLEKALKFTKKGRALGLGQCGFHTYLQQKMIPFESLEAQFLNTEIAKNIQDQAENATSDMAKRLGEPEWCEGYDRRNTHLCVTGDTKILTKEGQIEIKNIIGKNIDVWNGFEWSNVIPFETGESEIIKISFSNGSTLKVTPEHRFLIATAKRERNGLFYNKTVEVEAKNVRIGDCIPKFYTEKSGSNKKLENAYESGLFCGDGSINNSKSGKYPRNELRLYGDKKELETKINWKSSNTWGDENCIRGYLPDNILEKHIVPLEYDIESKTMWLCGLVDTDGSKTSSGISISMKDYEFANDVALLIQSLGGEYSICKVKRTGGYKSDNETYYVVKISFHSCMNIFSEIKPNRVEVPLSLPKCSIGKTHFVEVISIEKLDTKEMTYCFTEPKRNLGIFNGILTKQCAIAPTKSTALIMGGISEGINPDPVMIYSQLSAGGEVFRINPILLDLMKKYGKYNKKNIKNIIDDSGSVRNVSWLSKTEKDVLKGGAEIDQHVIIRLAAQRQQFVDQAQSINLFFTPKTSEKYISEVHKSALKNKDIISLYYANTISGDYSPEDSECVSCQ